MLKNVFLTFVVAGIAIGGGAASVWYSLDARDGGAIRIGPWTAFPDIGMPDADPYSQARIAREGVLALGRSEGLSFVAGQDSGGEQLRRDCNYTVEGAFPAARFWTLYAADKSLDVITGSTLRAAALQSRQILRRPDNSVIVSAGNHPSPGNWLSLTGSGQLYFVLNLYDTPIISSTGLADVPLPDIRKDGCDA